MKIKRDIVLMFSNITAIFIVIQSIFAVVCSKETTMISKMEYWYANVFRDILYPFMIIPFYFFVASYIDKFFSISTIVRINNRKKSMWIRLVYKIGVAFVIVSDYFILFLIMSIFFFDVAKENIKNCLFGYLCYILGLAISITFVEIIKRSEVKLLSSSPYFFVNLFMVFEITILVPTLVMNTSFKYPILFYWVFN